MIWRNNSMKKVIIFGIGSNYLLEDMGKLSMDYEIVAYMDYKYDYQTKTYCYKPFVFLNELDSVDFDYIIVLSKSEADTKKRCEDLKNAGVLENQIFPYFYWGGVERKVQFSNHVEGFKSLNYKFEGYLFGMSHSWLGFYTHLIKSPIYKFSWNSSDMHYTYNVVKDVMNNKYTDIKKLKYVLYEMPYYIFNYDYSNNGVNFRKGLTFWNSFGDYHHLQDSRSLEYMRYKLYLSMFGESERRRDDLVHTDDITWSRRVSQEEIDSFRKNISHVWKLNHERTIKENVYYFKSIVGMIRSFNPDIKIIVLVYPQLKYIPECFAEEFNKSKEFFYKQMSENEVEVWDYFDRYFEKEGFFGDVLHLNKWGATDFTKEINSRLIKERII